MMKTARLQVLTTPAFRDWLRKEAKKQGRPELAWGNWFAHAVSSGWATKRPRWLFSPRFS
jgi:hypothetical protein